jgi:putative effector of murein hydrolase LrgA (UPF0299 family)
MKSIELLIGLLFVPASVEIMFKKNVARLGHGDPIYDTMALSGYTFL